MAGTQQGWRKTGASGGTSGVQSVTGLNTDNTDPQNPIVKISVDGVTITGDGTSSSPLQANYLPSTNYGLYVQTALGTPVTNTIVETTLIGSGLGTLTVPANAFQVGDSFTAKMCGNISSSNLETLHIRVKSDGLVIADAGIFTLNLATNKHFELILDFTITKLGTFGVAELFANGQFTYNKNANNNIDGINFALIDNTSFDTTIINTLDITAEWGLAKPQNSIQSQNFVLNKIY